MEEKYASYHHDLKEWTDTHGFITLRMTLAQANFAYHTGDCDADVDELSADVDIRRQLNAMDPQKVKQYLIDAGFEEEKLTNKEDNLQRVLWMAACDLIDESKEV